MTVITEAASPAVRVKCCGGGFPPVLARGQYCKDGTGLWHFRTPDGTVFAAGGKGSLSTVRETADGICLVPAAPTLATDPGGRVITNVWTVEGAEWVFARDP